MVRKKFVVFIGKCFHFRILVYEPIIFLYITIVELFDLVYYSGELISSITYCNE